MRMRRRLSFVLAILALVAGRQAPHAQPATTTRPDLQGIWNGSTLTPLQRPPQFKDKAEFTRDEAAEYVRTSADRARGRLPSADDRATQIDVDDTYVEVEAIPLA